MPEFLRDNHGHNPISARALSIRDNTADEATFTMDAVLSTERAVQMFDYREWCRMDEVLLADGRVKAQHIPMLDTHNRSSIAKIMGHIDQVRTEGTDTVVRCNFDSDDPVAVSAFRKYKNRHARALSVGYTVQKWQDIEPGETAIVGGKAYTARKECKTRVVTKWRVDEGSLVCQGADSQALARSIDGVCMEMTDEEIEQVQARQQEVSRKKKRRVRVNHDGDHEFKMEAVAGTLLTAEREPQIVVNVHNSPMALGGGQQETSPARGASTELPVRTEKPEGSTLDPVSNTDEQLGSGAGKTGREATQMADLATSAGDTAAQQEQERVRTANEAAEKARFEKAREDAKREGVVSEQARQKAIRELAGDDVTPETLQRCLDNPDMSVESAKGEFLSDIRAKRTPPARSDAPQIILAGNRAERDSDVDVMTAAVALRMGGEAVAKKLKFMQFDKHTGKLRMKRATHEFTEDDRKEHERVVNCAYRFERKSQLDICRQALRLAQVEAPEEDEDIAQRAFSTPTLTSIYTNTMGAFLLMSLGDKTDSTVGWTREQDVKNFKDNELHRLEGGRLKKRNRGETARHASFSDTMEKYRLYEYAETLVIDRQDIIDDSLEAWKTAMTIYSFAIADIRPSLVYGFLATNGALLTDAIALFHASHNNLLTSSPLGATTLQNAVALLASQRGGSGLNLNLRDCVLITGETLSFTATQLTQSVEIREAAAANGTLNPLKSREIGTASDSRLNNGFIYPLTETPVAAAATTWYLAAKDGMFGIHVGFRDGANRQPTMKTTVLNSAGQYGMAMDINYDVGVGTEGYQGLVKAS